MRKYYKSKAKVYSLALSCILLTLFGAILMWCVFETTPAKIAGIGFLFLGLVLSIPQIRPQLSQTISLHQNYLAFFNCYDRHHKPPMNVKMEYGDIIRLGYSGSQYIPVSEALIVQTSDETIYVDFNFKNYLKLWNDIISIVRTNPHVQVDQRLKSRLEKFCR